MVRFIKEETGIHTLLFNTGWFLEERMDEILPYVDMLLLSLDSASPDRHDEIRGKKGLFDRLMKGVDLVRKKYPDLSTQFNTCVQKGIADDIDGLLELSEKKGMQISFDVITEFRRGEGDSHYTETDMGMPLQELRGVCEYLLAKKKEGAPTATSTS